MNFLPVHKGPFVVFVRVSPLLGGREASVTEDSPSVLLERSHPQEMDGGGAEVWGAVVFRPTARACSTTGSTLAR